MQKSKRDLEAEFIIYVVHIRTILALSHYLKPELKSCLIRMLSCSDYFLSDGINRLFGVHNTNFMYNLCLSLPMQFISLPYDNDYHMIMNSKLICFLVIYDHFYLVNLHQFYILSLYFFSLCYFFTST